MNHQTAELSKLIVKFLQGLRGGVQSSLHVPSVCTAEKHAADALAAYAQAIALALLPK